MNNYRILIIVNILTFTAIGITSPLLTLYLQGLGADLSLISLILTSVVIVSLAGAYAWGWLADRLGRRKPLYIVGLGSVAIAYFWLSQANGVAMAWPARLLDSVGMASMATLGLTLMGDTLTASRRKGRSMGLFRGIGSLAFALGAFIGGRMADAYSLPFAFLVCCGLFVAATIVALALHEVPALRKPVNSNTSDMKSDMKSAAGLPVLFLAGVALWTAAHVASTTMWPNYLSSFGYSKTTISSLWSLAALFEMPAMYLFGALSDVTGRAVVLATGGFLIALVQIGYLFFVQSLPALMGVQVLRGFGFGSYTSAAMTFTTEYGARQEHRGSNAGLFNATGSAGQLAGTMLGGTIAQAFGFNVLYVLCTMLAICSGICFLALRRSGESLGRHQETVTQ